MFDWPQWGVDINDRVVCDRLAEPWQLDPRVDVRAELAAMRDDRPEASVLALGARPRASGGLLRSPRVVTEADGGVRNTSLALALTPIYDSVCRDMGFVPGVNLRIRGTATQSADLLDWNTQSVEVTTTQQHTTTQDREKM